MCSDKKDVGDMSFDEIQTSCFVQLIGLYIKLGKDVHDIILDLNKFTSSEKHDKTKQTECLQYVANAMSSSSYGEIQSTKQHLLHALTISDELSHTSIKSLSLVMLAKLFVNTDTNKASKMYETAFQLFKKSGSCVIMKECSDGLVEMYSGMEDDQVYQQVVLECQEKVEKQIMECVKLEEQVF
jgi:hypothetical protein